MLKRRDWWLGIAAVVTALLIHAAIPRYNWSFSEGTWHRVDRWTGTVRIGGMANGRMFVGDLPTERTPVRVAR
jgi:hypothetical protein